MLVQNIALEDDIIMAIWSCVGYTVLLCFCLLYTSNPHAHVLLTMRAMDEHGKWLPKSRKVYDLDENGAVSYTHLDVYKRQIWRIGNITKPTVVLHRAVSFLRSLLTSICMSWKNL